MTTLKELVDDIVKVQAQAVMENTKDALRDVPETRKIIAKWGMAKLELLIYERLRNFSALQVARIGDEVRRHERNSPRRGGHR